MSKTKTVFGYPLLAALFITLIVYPFSVGFHHTGMTEYAAHLMFEGVFGAWIVFISLMVVSALWVYGIASWEWAVEKTSNGGQGE